MDGSSSEENELELQVRELAEILTDKNQEIEKLQAANTQLSTELHNEHEQRIKLQEERNAAIESPGSGVGRVSSTAVQTDFHPESEVRQLGEDITEQLEDTGTGTDEELLQKQDSNLAKMGNSKVREQVGLKFFWFLLGMHLCPVLILPDFRPAGYPANQKVGYRISGEGRVSGRIFNSTF
jgi:hypothetical protein